MILETIWRSKAIKWAIVSAILAGLSAYFIMVSLVGKSQVVVAKKKISKGQVVEADFITVKSVARGDVDKESIKEAKKVIGRKIKTTRLPGDQITKTAITGSKTKASKVPVDFVITPVHIQDYQSIAKYIESGCHTTIIAVKTEDFIDGKVRGTVLLDVLVLEATEIPENASQASADSTVLVALPLDKAQQLAEMDSKYTFKILVNAEPDLQ